MRREERKRQTSKWGCLRPSKYRFGIQMRSFEHKNTVTCTHTHYLLVFHLPLVELVTLYWTVMNISANFEVTCGLKQEDCDLKVQRSKYEIINYQNVNVVTTEHFYRYSLCIKVTLKYFAKQLLCFKSRSKSSSMLFLCFCVLFGCGFAREDEGTVEISFFVLKQK